MLIFGGLIFDLVICMYAFSKMNSFLDGKEAVEIFNKSGLDKQTLRSSKQK